MNRNLLDKILRPTHEDLLKRHLHDAQWTLAEHQQKLEFYSATVPMLQKRVTRLKEELGCNPTTKS